MKRYVAGFMFNSGCTHVALVEKQKPEWQKGRLNAIGGKIEKVQADDGTPGTDGLYFTDEAPVAAMVREFFEETGYQTQESDWTEFCLLSGPSGDMTGPHWQVHFFFHVAGFHDIEKRLRTTTDERIIVEPIRHRRSRIANLEWLIPMALSTYMGGNTASLHLVSEVQTT